MTLFHSSLMANELTLIAPHEEVLKDKNITLTLKDKNGTEIKKDIKWITSQKNSIKQYNTNTITPLKDGFMKLQAKYKNQTSNEITLNIKWIVNGHELPPEPDEKINNSTLLGIDVNKNDVRDDVERWIYETYKDKHPIHIDIAMQGARGYKKTLVMPEKALEIHDEVLSPICCEHYYSSDATEYNEPILIKYGEDIDAKTKSKYFNTKERYRIYLKEYDRKLSGHTFDLPWSNERKKYCDFNTSKYDKK